MARVTLWAGLSLAALCLAAWAWCDDVPTTPVERAALAVPGTAKAPAPQQLRPWQPLPQVQQQPATVQAVSESFARAGDLYALFQRASGSSDARTLEQAALALQGCSAYLRDSDELRQAQAVIPPARQSALDEISRRCAGFARALPRELLVQRLALQAHLEQAGSRFAQGIQVASSALPAQTVRALLSEGSVDGFELARPTLAARLAQSRGLGNDAQDEPVLEAALLLASCDAGRDCSEAAFDALNQCARHGACNQGLTGGWQGRVSPARVEDVLSLHRDIVEALNARDFTRLGL